MALIDKCSLRYDSFLWCYLKCCSWYILRKYRRNSNVWSLVILNVLNFWVFERCDHSDERQSRSYFPSFCLLCCTMVVSILFCWWNPQVWPIELNLLTISTFIRTVKMFVTLITSSSDLAWPSNSLFRVFAKMVLFVCRFVETRHQMLGISNKKGRAQHGVAFKLKSRHGCKIKRTQEGIIEQFSIQ